MRVGSTIARLFALLQLGLFLCVCNAQPFFQSKQWHVTEGLPSELVQAVAQTPDHYLWIGTAAGLVRFDGERFSLYNQQNTPQLTSDRISCLLVTADGTLWIGAEASGVVRYKGGMFERFGTEDGMTHNTILSFSEDRQHTLWVGTNEGVLAWTGERFEPMSARLGAPARTTFAVIRDAHGSVWLGGSTLLRVEGGKLQEFPLQSKTGNLHVHSLLEGDDGVIWVGTTSGLFRSTPQGSFLLVADVAGTVRTLKQTSDGTLWAGTVGGGIYTLRRGSKSAEHFSEAFANKAILSITEDSEANVWAGTQSGLLRLSRTPVDIVPIADASNLDFGSLMRDDDGTLWMCSTQVQRIRNGQVEPFQPPALRGTLVRTLTRDRDGSLWVGTEGKGLLHLSAQNAVDRSFSHKLVSNNVRAILQARDGTLWVGTDSGLSHIAPGGITDYRSVNGHSAAVMAMLEDHSGDLWVGTFYGLLHLHDGHAVEDGITAAMGQRNIWSLHESWDGTLWIGTNDGVYLAKGGTVWHVSHAQGLPWSQIYQILESHDGRVWLSSPSGVAVFDRGQFGTSEAVGRTVTPGSSFNISADFAPAELFGSVQSAGLTTPAGDVWYPSTRGLIHIVPNLPSLPSPFPLRIVQVLVDGRSVPLDEPITLSAGSAHLTLSYSPILLSSQSSLRFRVKLEDFDRDWQELSAERTAYYTNLPSGRFKFRVQAFRVGSPAEIQETSILVVKLSPFYRRPWFVILLLLLVCLIAGVSYRLRLRRIQTRFRFILEERNRVAREMHDTVIQGCTTISALLEAASGLRETDEPSSRELNELAKRQIESTIIEARQAVWNLRHGVPLEDDLEAAVAKIAEDASQESPLQVAFTRSGEPFPISPAVSHELLMTIREAVRNALTHAHPKSVSIKVAFQPHLLAVEIQDDGAGFDTGVLAASHLSHFGLQGMQERTRRIGARLDIQSSANRGTCVTIEASAAVCRNDRASKEVRCQPHPYGCW